MQDYIDFSLLGDPFENPPLEIPTAGRVEVIQLFDGDPYWEVEPDKFGLIFGPPLLRKRILRTAVMDSPLEGFDEVLVHAYAAEVDVPELIRWKLEPIEAAHILSPSIIWALEEPPPSFGELAQEYAAPELSPFYGKD